MVARRRAVAILAGFGPFLALIGKFFAVLIANEVDDISRFANEKKLCSYIGIIPSTFSSGGRTFHGKLTKQGNKYLRWALVEAIWPAVRSDPELGAYYQKTQEWFPTA